MKLGKKLVRRHELLEQFLRIIGVEEEEYLRRCGRN